MADILTIPEDGRLAARIRDCARTGTLGHAIILSGQGDLLRCARFAAAAMECTGGDAPCGQCPACSKVLRDIHPDVITVTDPDHKNISVDVLRSLRSDAYILPNEGKRKIYIFPDCDLLEPKAQNVLLKVLEEGPAHAAFLFCARNSASLLQTIRSRCVEWKVSATRSALPADEGAGTLGRLIAEGKTGAIAAFCTDLENSKTSREELAQLLSDTRDLMSRALCVSYGGTADDPLAGELARQLSRRRIARAAEILEQFSRQCAYNINVGHLTGALSVALTELKHD